MRGPGQKSGVHAARVGDDQATAAGEDLAQALSFLIEHGRSVHNLHYPRKSSQFPVLSSQRPAQGVSEN